MLDSTSATAGTVVARLPGDRETLFLIEDAVSEEFSGIASSTSLEASGGWSLELHFSTPPDEARVRALVGAVAGVRVAQRVRFELLAPTDWVRKSLSGLRPVEAGRFIVHGSHDRGRIPINRIGIEIEASLAFGTGHHASTQACLLAIDLLRKAAGQKRRTSGDRPGSRNKPTQVLDLGTGTGVLAIAAGKVLARPVLASDMDWRSVTVARENARLNRVARFVKVLHAAGVQARPFRARAPYGLILANLLLEPLRQMATPLAGLTARKGHLVLSGLLAAQAPAALASYRARGLVLSRRITLGGWTTLVLQRPTIGRSLPPECTALRLRPCSRPASSLSTITPKRVQAERG
jgi:ribosomal protein L11 methyltransferase